MVSTALTDWRSTRADRLDRLFKAHAAVGGQGRGRRWETEELNHSILLRLASEFQGFCRDLHGESAKVLAGHLAAGDQRMYELLTAGFVWNRKLDSGNATPGAVGAGAMDNVCADHLTSLIGRPPW